MIVPALLMSLVLMSSMYRKTFLQDPQPMAGGNTRKSATRPFDYVVNDGMTTAVTRNMAVRSSQPDPLDSSHPTFMSMMNFPEGFRSRHTNNSSSSPFFFPISHLPQPFPPLDDPPSAATGKA